MTRDGDIGLACDGDWACGGGDERWADATFVAGLALTPFPPIPELPAPSTGLPRGAGTGADDAPAAAPPLALFSKAAASAEALGRLEAPMMAAALPVAVFVLAAGAVDEEAGRW